MFMNTEAKFSPHEEALQARLRHKKYAQAYLKASMEQSGAEGPQILLLALRRIAEAHGMKRLAEAVELPLAHLDQLLSADGNPTLDVLLKILNAFGLTLSVADPG